MNIKDFHIGSEYEELIKQDMKITNETKIDLPEGFIVDEQRNTSLLSECENGMYYKIPIKKKEKSEYVKLRSCDFNKIVANVGYVNGLTKTTKDMLNSLHNFGSLDKLRDEINDQIKPVMEILLNNK